MPADVTLPEDLHTTTLMPERVYPEAIRGRSPTGQYQPFVEVNPSYWAGVVNSGPASWYGMESKRAALQSCIANIQEGKTFAAPLGDVNLGLIDVKTASDVSFTPRPDVKLLTVAGGNLKLAGAAKIMIMPGAWFNIGDRLFENLRTSEIDAVATAMRTRPAWPATSADDEVGFRWITALAVLAEGVESLPISYDGEYVTVPPIPWVEGPVQY